MEVLKSNEQAVEIVLTPQDVESAVRQFICTCHPKFANNWILNPKYNLGAVLFAGTKADIPEKIEDRIKDFNDICAEAGVNPAEFVIPVGASQRQIGSIAFNRLQLIFEVANEGWEADWDNSNQPKYYIIWKYTPGSGFSYDDCAYSYTTSYVGSRLSTFSAERAKWIAETFRNEFNQFLTKTN